MARLIGPDEAYRLVYLSAGAGKGRAAAQGLEVVIYTDAALTTLANILTVGGDPITGSKVTVDQYSLLPQFQFPDGVDTLYASADGGPAAALYANVDGRLDALGTAVAAAQSTATGALVKSANLGDLSSATTARTNLGLGGAAVLGVGTAAGTVAAGDDTRITGAMAKSANLGDVSSASSARSNLGLGTAAVRGVGTSSGTVAAGDDTRITGALQSAGGTLTGPLLYKGLRIPAFPQKTRRRPQATSSWLFQSGHGFTAGGSGTASSNVNDTTDFIKGRQAARVTTTGTGATSNLKKTSLSAIDLTGKEIRVTLKVDDVTHLDHIYLYAGTSSLANYFLWALHVHPTTGARPYVNSGEWVTITVGWADVIGIGGTFTLDSSKAPSTKTGFTGLQVAVFDDAAGAVTWHLQSIEVVDATSSKFTNGVVSITFDDSWLTQYTDARAIMDGYDMPGTAYTIADIVSVDSSYMTVNQLRTLQDYSGWEIGGHAYSSVNHGQTNGFESLTAAQVDEDFFLLRNWLAGNGFRSDNLAYPKGRFGTTTDGVYIDQIAERYFASSRSIISETIGTVPPPMYHRLKSLTGVSEAAAGNTPTTFVATGGPLDRAKKQAQWLVLAMHEIVPDGTATATTQVTVSGFQTMIDAIASSGMAVRTVYDVMNA